MHSHPATQQRRRSSGRILAMAPKRKTRRPKIIMSTTTGCILGGKVSKLPRQSSSLGLQVPSPKSGSDNRHILEQREASFWITGLPEGPYYILFVDRPESATDFPWN